MRGIMGQTGVRECLSLIALLRVRDWLHFLPLPLLMAPRTLSEHSLLGIASAACCLAFAYGWNEWKDRREAEGGGVGCVLTLLGILALSGLALAFCVSKAAAIAALISLVASFLYSGGPRLKRFPIVVTIANVFIFAPLAFLAWDGGEIATEGLLLLGAFTSFLLQNQAIHEVAHLRQDAASSIRTTAALLKDRMKAVVAVTGVVGVLAIISIGFREGEWWAYLVASLPMAVVTFWSASVLDRKAATARLIHRYGAIISGCAAWLLYKKVL